MEWERRQAEREEERRERETAASWLHVFIRKATLCFSFLLFLGTLLGISGAKG